METVRKINSILIFTKDNMYIWFVLIFCYLNLNMLMLPAFAQENISETIIVTCNDKQYIGKLLYATKSELILWQSKQPYNSDQINDYVKLFHYSEIDHIVIDKKGQFWTGAGYGFVIGGGAGAVSGMLSRNNSDDYLVWTMNTGRRTLKEGLKFGIPSAIIGGIVGAVISADKEFVVQKNNEKYHTLVPELRKRAIYSFTPPSELQAYIAQSD